MQNQIQLNQVFCTSKNLISRRNQDDTVIIMKSDDANIFYKIDGVAASIWHLFQSPANAQSVLNHLQTQFSKISTENIATDFNTFILQLLEFDILQSTTESIPLSKEQDIVALFKTLKEYSFGQIKSFDLAQIETEVLNESIYLDVFAGSDLRLKKDVTPLKNSLDKILSLDGVSYLWNESTASAEAPKNQQIGLVAQQVALAMPELVKKDMSTGVLGINYTKLTPYLIESIKELKRIIDQQNNKIEALQAEITKMKH